MRYAASIIATLAALPATAQDIPLAPIVVTPNRAPVEASRTGSSVTVITQDELDASGAQTLGEVLARVPGVTVTQSGSLGGTTNLRIRGASQEYTAVYVDGIRVDDPAANVVAYDLGSTMIADIGRIEVLRGSQSALYGGSSVGGVVNITSRRAERDGFSHRLEAGYGSAETRKLAYGMGFRQDKLEASLNVAHLATRGFSSIDTLRRDPAAEDDGAEINRLSFSARYQATDTLAIGGAAFRQNANNDYDGFSAEDRNRQKRDETGARLFAEWKTGQTTHLFDATRYTQDRNAISTSVQDYDATRTAFGYQGTSVLSPSLTLIYGADTTRETAKTPGFPGGNDGRVSGAWVQALWAITPDLDLSATVRRDDNSRFGGFNSGRLAAAWQVSDAVVLRAQAARGFRAPSLYQQYGDPGNEWFSIEPNTALRPEESRSYELGADVTLAGGAVLSATVFSLDIKDAITYCGAFDIACLNGPTAPFTNRYENRPGTSERSGVELSAAVPVTDAVTVTGGYAYIDARTPSGERLPRVPHHDLSLAVDADFGSGLSGNVALNHIARNAVTQFEQPLDDYTVVNAGLSKTFAGDLTVSVTVNNLFDEEYQIVDTYGTQPRSVFVGLRKAW